MKYTQKSPSKINLFLKITGKLDNGYHEIDTVFLPLDNPCDEVIVTLNDEDVDNITITSSSSHIPCDEKNLCWKAVDAYSKATQCKISCSIHIEKNIPVAAGMGGGSSNAAAVLTILNEKYNLLTSDELAELALSLGADVPFFLKPQLSSATGVGEKLTPVDFDYEKLPVIIIAPHFPVSAAWAYTHCSVAEDSNVSGEMKRVLNAVEHSDHSYLGKLIRNDLAIPLYDKFPLLTIIKEEVISLGALCCEVSGSGPTMFALCKSDKDANEIAEKLSESLPDTFSVIVA